MLENNDSTLFENFTCAFAIPKISTTRDSGQRLVLRLDNELWTNIINQSGLLNVQGRSILFEWASWTHNDKTITSDKIVLKNIRKCSMFCCSSTIFPRSVA